jgi:hypothetical protein
MEYERLTCTKQKYAYMIDFLSSRNLKEGMCLIHLLQVGLQETTSNATPKHDG